jgi:hypothetical protein
MTVSDSVRPAGDGASLAAAAMTANIPARIVLASRPALVLDIERSTPTHGKAAAPAGVM